MFLFQFATFAPLALLIAGSLAGGWWIAGAVAMITLFTWAADHLMRRAAAATGSADEFPTGDALAVALALILLAGLALAVRAFGRDGFSTLERAGLMGHHASSHLRVHHVHVGPPDDPASAAVGTGFWRYAARAWGGSFMAGLRAESTLRARAAVPAPRWSHPYVAYGAGAVLALGLACLLAGIAGIMALIGIAAHAQLQILLSDYIQHYGLRRLRLPDGRLEPVGPRHSWNAPQAWSSAMMLNAPRHSVHHAQPSRPYPALRLDSDMPMLPRAVPVMAVAALIPPLWRRMMDRRARAWSAD